MKIYLRIFFLLICFQKIVLAQTSTTSLNGSWGVTTNWSSNQVPNAATQNLNVFVKNTMTIEGPSKSNLPIDLGNQKNNYQAVGGSGFGLRITGSQNYVFGGSSATVSAPAFSGSIQTAVTNSSTIQFSGDVKTLLTGGSSGVVDNFLIQSPKSGYNNSLGYGPKFGKNNDKYFNVILGRLSGANSQSATLYSVPRSGTGNDFAGASFNITSAQSYASSVIIDEVGNTKNDLALTGTSQSRATATFKSGISNFEGIAFLSYGDLVIEDGATLVLGDINCRVCDTSDPAYDANKCSSMGTTCTSTKLTLATASTLNIKSGGRLIVYGNASFGSNQNNSYSIVSGSIYIVGNLATPSGSVDIRTTCNGQTTSVGVSCPNGYDGDVYATGTMSFTGGGSTNFFGTNPSDCVTPPCQASSDLCGFSISMSPQGTIAACSGQQIVGLLNTGVGAGGYTIILQRYNSVNLAYEDNFSLPGVEGTASYFFSIPQSNDTENYRLKVSKISSTCVAFSPEVITVLSTTANKWKTDAPSKDWFNSANWCLGRAPLQTEDVLVENAIINNTNYPEISTGAPATVRNLILSGSSSLKISNGSSLTIYGNLELQNSATFTGLATSDVIFNASGLSGTISGCPECRRITYSSSAGQVIQFNNLQVATGTSLLLPLVGISASSLTGTVNDGDGKFLSNSIKISGNLTVDGDLQVPSGGLVRDESAIVLNGASAINQIMQTSGSTALDYFIIGDNTNSPASVTFSSGTFDLFGKLSFNGSNVQINSFGSGGANGYLRLKSISALSYENSRISMLSTGSALNGNYIFERFMPVSSATSQYKYLASPVSGVADSKLSNRYSYTTSTSSWKLESGNIQIGVGYSILYNSSDYNSSWVVTGTLGQDVRRLLCRTNTTLEPNCIGGRRAVKGWHLLGNPFPHPIYWANSSVNTNSYKGYAGFGAKSPTPGDQTTFDTWPSGISKVVAIRNNSLDGNYGGRLVYAISTGLQSLSAGDSESFWFGGKQAVNNNGVYSFDGRIDTGQSFWVYSYGDVDDPGTAADESGNDVRLTISEAAKKTTLFPTFYNRQESLIQTNDKLAIELSNGNVADNCFLRIIENSSSNQVALPKLWNEDVSIYFPNAKSDQLNLDILRSLVLDSLYIPIGIQVFEKGYYQISFDFSEDFIFSNSLYLIDHFLGTSVPLSQKKYQFVISEGELKIENRFSLSLKPIEIENQLQIDIYPNPVNSDFIFVKSNDDISKCDLRVFNSSGLLLKEILSLNDNKILVDDLIPGVYFFRFTSDSGQLVKKVVVSAR